MLNQRRSPFELRQDDTETLETYHPSTLNNNINTPNDIDDSKNKAAAAKGSKLSWLPRLVASRSQSVDRNGQLAQASRTTTTTNGVSGPTIELQQLGADHNFNRNKDAKSSGLRVNRKELYNNYYGRSRVGLGHGRRSSSGSSARGGNDDDEEEDNENDDQFDEPVLTIPYTSSSMQRSTVVRQRTDAGVVAFPPSNNDDDNSPINDNDNNHKSNAHDYLYDEYFMDDRQGMNQSEQQFTKGEEMNRRSFDGSFISELDGLNNLHASGGGLGAGGHGGGSGGKGSSSGAGKSSAAGGKSSGKGNSDKSGKQRQVNRTSSSSSPTNLSRRSRHSRRGFMGLASRLKLTRKHEPIAKLQLSILNSGLVSLKTLDRDLQTFLPKERLTPKEFEYRVKLMRKYEVLSQIEYRFASRYEIYVCRHATQESNQPKNNYKKCIPYDYNRVVLKTLPNVPNSDYINASHVDSCLKPNAYIAAQGPNENTIEDFWRMIWEQKTFVVVMLTKVFDFIRAMCNQYWPVELNKPERYGNLEVTLLYEEPLADFVIRTIRLTKLRANQRQQPAKEGGGQEEDRASKTKGDGSRDDSCEPEGEEDGDYEEDEDYSDDTSIDDLIMSDLQLDQNQSPNRKQKPESGSSLPPVRSPKFRVRQRRARARGEHSPRRDRQSPRVPKSTTERQQQPVSFKFDEPPPRAASASGYSGQFLSAEPRRSATDQRSPSPLGSRSLLTGGDLTGNQLHYGLNSPLIDSMPGTPLTPGGSGLDRSSATRRAVKKKRRARTKNQRPLRTQFQVPDESQLVDDEDDDYLDEAEALDQERGSMGASQDQLNEGDAGAGDQTPGATGQQQQRNSRIIYQFHYNSWASHTCPFINSLLHFRRRVRICMDEMSKSGKTGPAVVHCNDGCGRTGTYLCIDANLELAEEDNVYDVFNYTKKMRQSRKFLIENLEQYKFVYDTIEEAMFCGKTWFPVAELHKRLKHKSQRNPLTKKNEYQREYEKITRMTSKFSIGDCAGGHRVENREKNRDVSTVPPDNFRPYLTSFQTNDNTDYINAVFVDGYTRSKEYIVTEWPSHRTISDFWSLIYDHECNSVILLANPGESSTYPSFLPTEKELRRKFGPVFSAELVSYTHYQNIKSWIYTINKKIVSLTEVIAGVKSETKTTQVFQITCWPQGHRVPTSTNALVELMNMVECWRRRTAYGPVCVVSLDGKSRAGVYCAANVAIEQVVQHSEVDVFQAVKTVRRHRPQLIENMTEYKYCYDLILHYVLHYVNQPHSK